MNRLVGGQPKYRIAYLHTLESSFDRVFFEALPWKAVLEVMGPLEMAHTTCAVMVEANVS